MTYNTYSHVDTLNQVILDDNEIIIDVVLSNGYSVALTSKGRLFTWGYNLNGELSDGTTENQKSPEDISYVYVKVDSFYQKTYMYNENIEAYIINKEGFLFDGWYTGRLFTNKYVFTIMPANNITLYARWIPIE
ncbi:InlB B-repeat-containing protein [Acholeplasma equifetale]|uniref:InlB B-repeat-containing protein n=1 Tax=Acholeplasma equifetale TaxID=264634 RepID=UPI003CCBEAF2